jgi:hypothetical protein
VAGRGVVIVGEGRVVSLAVAFNDVLHRLVKLRLAKVSVVLCLDGFPPVLNCSVNFLLEGSPIGCGSRGESLFCLGKQLLLLLKQSRVHVADCNSIVLR